MKCVNVVFLLGNVGQDPEVRATSNGGKVAKISLATNEKYRNKAGQDQERTEWHRLTCFGKLADIAESYVKKGDKLHVRGRLQYSTTESENGQTKYWTDIIVDDLTLLGGNAAQAPSDGMPF